MLTKSTLTAMPDKLEETGFIKRNFDREDRRKIRIKRTEKNDQYRELFDRVSEDMTGIRYEGFSPNEVKAFEDSLAKILGNLINKDKQIT